MFAKMKCNTFLLLSLSLLVSAKKYNCNYESTLLLTVKNVYEFSTKFLDRVSQEMDSHFVYSPLWTWLSLTDLSEGARGLTLRELWEVTKHHKNPCFRRKLRDIMNDMDDDLDDYYTRKNVIAIDKRFDVKPSFLSEVSASESTDVLLTDFSDKELAANEVNGLVRAATSGAVQEVVYPDDFNSSLLITVDTGYFRGLWRHPFDPRMTTREDFYKDSARTHFYGSVNMMNQFGNFNFTELHQISVKVLELPFDVEDLSMLMFLPTQDTISNLFYDMREISLQTIFSLFEERGPVPVNVKIPRFNITTDIDNIPELVMDMGAKSMFRKEAADFQDITDERIRTSLMIQIADILVTEDGVMGAQAITRDEDAVEQFVANQPFSFMIVNRELELILFAGTYSKPTVY